MSFFKKLTSRSRSNSYVDDDYVRSPAGEQGRPPSSYQSPSAQYPEHEPLNTPPSSKDADTMYPSQNQGYSNNATRPLNGNGPSSSGNMRNSSNRHDNSTRDSGYADAAPMSPSMKTADHGASGGGMGSAGMGAGGVGGADLLTRAFNEAVRPYTEKIDMLEQQLADMQDWVQGQEQQRMEIFAWIDKRGLRPDVPPAIAKQMDADPSSAASLNAQLDRKITIVNFDLHRLQDDLNDSISSAHFASAMAKFLPDIQRLASLRTGAKYAYELLIKLVGNLNSHGGLEANAGDGGSESGVNGAGEVEEDRRARAAFYARMDEELVDVVGRRCDERGDDWGKAGIAGEVKRLERNGAYLRNLGIESYFPKSLDVMKSEASGGHNGGHSGGHGGYSTGGTGEPPGYSH